MERQPDAIEAVRRRLLEARSVCALTGSGISAESGLPTFRGAGGLWQSHRVEELASPEGFARDPHLVWTWYNERRAAHAGVDPNAGHRALARLETLVADLTLITQNVDSLHWRAGSRNVVELHGNLRETRCNRCGEIRQLEGATPFEDFEHACGGRFRPAVVWFGEALPLDAWDAAAEAVARSEVLLVVGTSGVVYPAAALATRGAAPRALIVEINPEPTPLSQWADVVLRGTAASVLPALASERGETIAGSVGSCGKP
jgi:NAD-dependent deacetylase